MNRRQFLRIAAGTVALAATGAVASAVEPPAEAPPVTDFPAGGAVYGAPQTPRIHGIRERRHQALWDTIVRGARTDEPMPIAYPMPPLTPINLTSRYRGQIAFGRKRHDL